MELKKTKLAIVGAIRKINLQFNLDASAYGAGAVLLQEDDHGIDHSVYSVINNNQVNYCTIEKEALALLLGIQKF